MSNREANSCSMTRKPEACTTPSTTWTLWAKMRSASGCAEYLPHRIQAEATQNTSTSVGGMYRRLLATVLLVFSSMASAQVNVQTINVTVQSATNVLIEGATVCWSTNDAPAQWWGLRTNAQGVAQLKVPMPSPANAQPGNPIGGLGPGAIGRGQMVTIIASSRNFNKSITRPAALATAVIQLPGIIGGVVCPSGVRPQPSDSSFVDLQNAKRAVEQFQARMNDPANQVIRRVPTPNTGEQCFGALGMQCGQEKDQVSSCRAGICLVNKGSWTHDECCAANPDGFMCGGRVALLGARCSDEFLLGAAYLDNTPYNWLRRVDFTRVNNSGIVERALYCAPGGTFQPGNSSQYCCSQRLEPLDALDIAYLSLLNPLYSARIKVDRMQKCAM